MLSKTSWLLIVLIALLQVAMLLLVEIGMVGWIRSRSEDVVLSKTEAENCALIHNVYRLVGDTEHLSDARYLEAMKAVVAKHAVADSGFISINCVGTGEMIYPSENRPFTWRDIVHRQGNAQFEEILQNKLFASIPFSGEIQRTGETQIVSLQRDKHRPFFLAVHRGRNALMADIDHTIAFAHKIGFSLVLLVGLISAILIFSVLTRFKNRVLKITGDLQLDLVERADELKKTKNAVIYGLAKLAESRDNDTGEHLDRIRSYVTILAKDLKLVRSEIDDQYIENLAVASSLHDIGKVGIPDSILLKPGRLSEKERSIMEMHAVIGGECLDAIQSRLGDNEFMNIATEVAYSHHERWDGTGYPYGLAEEDIPLAARIVSVADVYDALTSKRPYKKAMTHTESRAIIVAGSGSQFDPEVVAAFLRHEHEFEVISVKQQFLDDDEATSSFQKLAQTVANQTDEERQKIASR